MCSLSGRTATRRRSKAVPSHLLYGVGAVIDEERQLDEAADLPGGDQPRADVVAAEPAAADERLLLRERRRQSGLVAWVLLAQGHGGVERQGQPPGGASGR